MRNENRIKELKDDRYTFSLDNKQIASIIISTVLLGVVLFFTGYFVGKEGVNTKTINNEIKTKNIAIINPNNHSSKDKTYLSKKEVNKPSDIANHRKGEAVTRPEAVRSANGEKNKKEEKNSNDKTTIVQTDTEKPDVSKKETKVAINTPELPKKVNDNKGTGDKPFKTVLKSNENGKYVIQVLATPKTKEAEELKNRLIESGYKAFVEQINSNGVIYNRVRIGFFKNSQEAKLFKNNFEKESGIKKTFITIKK